MSNLENVAKQIGVSTDSLNARIAEVLDSQGSAWTAAGRNSDEQNTMALRVAARQLSSERARIQSSGCSRIDGMFVAVPPKKDWASMAYRKMAVTLNGNSDMRDNLVSSGEIIYYINNGDGSFTKNHNPTLTLKQPFEADMDSTTVDKVPERSVELDNGDYFSLVWEKGVPTLPSGDSNWKYGAPRPLNEPERSCKFLGVVDGGELTMFSVRLQGDLASKSYPTFTPGYIAAKVGKNDTLWGKAGVTSFEPDANVASIFPGPPLSIGENGPEGIIPQMVTEFIGGLADMRTYHDAHREDEDWWGQTIATIVEVVQIDPRENGGWTVTVGDLDILSEAPTMDIWLPKGDLDFGVGSEMVIMGAPWKTRDTDEMRLSLHGWWVSDSIAPTPSDDLAGWDE